ncbi:lanthionine synthetase LanC family protein [Ilumatobacter sp.]|uniref:lanthionine synthetase LanC family protein n=1 Tax=Ilumatobacter sp. TaxID=1967498 RepID=UPI003C6BB939
MATQEILDRVFEADRFIERCRRDDVWTRTPEAPETPHTLYHGTAGIILFQLELHRATGDVAHLDRAIAAGDAIVASLNGRDVLSCAIYSGAAGHVFVLNELAMASGEERFRAAAVDVLDRIMGSAQPLGSGIGWIEPMPFSAITGMTGDRELLDLSIGAAGTGTVLLYAHRQGLDDRALGWARQVADRLLEMSIETEHGPNWPMMADQPFPFNAPNFAHGASGVGYFFADLHRETGDRDLLDSAVAAAGYVMANIISTEPPGDEESFLVRHTEEGRPRGLCYLGLCHGPVGTGRLFHLLHEITGDEIWRLRLDANMRGLEATGAPEVRSDGLWNNYGQCCGDAGIGDYALSLYRLTGDERHLALARRFADVVLAVSEVEDGARSWPQAEHRTRPEFVEAQTGYMQGAAGIGSFLLHLATIDDAEPVKIVLPESPFTFD